MRKILPVFLFLILVFLTNSSVFAQPLKESQVPEPLRTWIPWVMEGHEEERCPYLQSGDDQRQCAWAGTLQLKLGDQKGSFSQTWEISQKTWVPLPGDKEHPPLNVNVNGQSAKTIREDGKTKIFLGPGNYNISGDFHYDEMPESFSIPPQTGVLRLQVRSESKPFPQMEAGQGLIWLQKDEGEDAGQNRLEIRVHRKLNDEIPFLMTTLLTLNVSGQSREITLKKIFPESFIPMELKSPLPARVENGNQLKLQIKPGEWRIELKGRHQGPVKQLSLGEHSDPWPKEEVWVFEAQNDLRLVWIEGVPSIDPQQTTLPDAWKKLPAYRMRQGETLKFVEKRRGDSDPAPDQLNLYRQWWLDFNGGGFTLHDEISGTLRRSWRLEMNPPVELGRISVDGDDQFITKLPGGKREGIELRQGSLKVSADSRIDEPVRSIPAVGWDNDFNKVSGELNLPPGWTLWAVMGVDQVPGTWVNRWTLLDIFLVLITALTFFKLWGWRWGFLALITFVLTFPELEAPRWIWLALVAGIALLKLIPKGKFHIVLKIYKIGALLILFIITIPFMVSQLRVGLYPALEHPHETMNVTSAPHGRVKRKMKYEKRAADGAPLEEADIQMEEPLLLQKAPMPSGKSGYLRSKIDSGYSQKTVQRQMNLAQQRPGTKVQTGPGLPRWEWNSYSLTWNGPVKKDQSLTFIIFSPWANLLLAFVRVFLLCLLILCVLEIGRDAWKKMLRPKMAMLLLPLLFFVNPVNAQADIPSKEILEELRERLIAEPACFPNCASIAQMNVSATPQELTLRLQMSSDYGAALPLPGSAKEWSPVQVSVDGSSGYLFRDSDGILWLNLSPGVHQVLMSGPLPPQGRIQIALPARPSQVKADLSGWSLEGLRENGLPDSTLVLNRIHQKGVSSDSPLNQAQGGLKPFVRVDRELILGLNWEIETHVERVSPGGTPVVLEVPLLEGESVITQGIRVVSGKALVNMGPNQEEIVWRSVLNESSKIQLVAPEANHYMEWWTLNVSPVWHVDFKGIPSVHPSSDTGAWMPQWRPWPGEKLEISVSRPEGVPGQTLTIDQSLTEVSPGLRYTEINLKFKVRSSLGGQHVLALPEGAELQTVKINGNLQPIRMEQGKITLPVVPGPQSVEIKWQQEGGIRLFFRLPEINLGTPSVNSEIQFKIGNSRWVLFTGGPTMGPAVMFWSLLIVILLFSYGLARLGWTPLKTWHWFLLGIGISQFPEFPVIASLFIAAWLLSLGWRRNTPGMHKFWFDLRQLALLGYTFFAILALFAAIHQGLLGMPEMQIAGNGSTHRLLRWFQDRSENLLKRPWVLSVPLFYYRIAMLAWALWIALALIRWLRWGWESFNQGGVWKSLGVLKKKSL